MPLKTHDFAKLIAYKAGTVYLKLYMFLYLYAFIVISLVTAINKALENEMWDGFIKTVTGNGLTFAFLYFAATLLLIATAVYNVVMLPLFEKQAYRSIFIHQIALLAYRPLILLFAFAMNEIKKINLVEFGIIYSVEVAFVIINTIYFKKRKDLFYSDIVKYITGKEKDLTKH
jgi:hypothetical protein